MVTIRVNTIALESIHSKPLVIPSFNDRSVKLDTISRCPDIVTKELFRIEVLSTENVTGVTADIPPESTQLKQVGTIVVLTCATLARPPPIVIF